VEVYTVNLVSTIPGEVHYSPRSLVREGEGWTRPLIAAVLHTILHNLFGFRRDSYTEDSHFCRDMGID
jgi:hypothetical protein